jgi:putative transcriptional regulator
MARWLSGQLLVASPTIGDPSFSRSVVLIVDHDRDGALGIVLNRPTETTVQVAVPEIATLFDDDDVVHDGGPVQPDALLTMAEFRDPADAALLVLGRIGMVRGDHDPREPNVARARAYAGYAGWAPKQLEEERARGDWIVTAARPDDLFRANADDLWSIVLDRLGGPYSSLARRPADPSVN